MHRHSDRLVQLRRSGQDRRYRERKVRKAKKESMWTLKAAKGIPHLLPIVLIEMEFLFDIVREKEMLQFEAVGDFPSAFSVALSYTSPPDRIIFSDWFSSFFRYSFSKACSLFAKSSSFLLPEQEKLLLLLLSFLSFFLF